jgi:thymidylate synthase
MSQIAKPNHFPLIEAFLEQPEEGQGGRVGVCTNMTTAGQVRNEIVPDNRPQVPVLGTLIVNRDGAERMVLNSLVHPSLDTIVLFGSEGVDFAPSTNLLKAVQAGLDPTDGRNHIVGGLGGSAGYPNLTLPVFDVFRETTTVLPLYSSERRSKPATVETYLGWLAQQNRVSLAIIEHLEKSAGTKAKVHYGTLNKLIEMLGDEPRRPKPATELNAQDFQHLQPPIFEVEPSEEKPSVPFRAEVNSAGNIVVTLRVGTEILAFIGDDEFDLAFTIMDALGEKKKLLTPLDQLMLGAEIGRSGVQMRNAITVEQFSRADVDSRMAQTIPMRRSGPLKTDKKYYYRVRTVDEALSVMCMSTDRCEEVFDLRGDGTVSIIRKLAELNRFEDYEMDILHRMDIGTQIAKARIAADHGQKFMQDFPALFLPNTTTMPFEVAESDTFLDAHRRLITRTYTEGLQVSHADAHKGLTRTVGALVVLRSAASALEKTPGFYQQGTEPPEVTRAAYAAQLLRFDDDGGYSYGERTRTHFGFDQLPAVVDALRADPSRAAIIQRFDPSVDMSWEVTAGGKREYSHDPCLSHDIYWIGGGGKLQSFHIARAHNLVNAYPDNIYGLHDAYVQTIAQGLGVDIGDIYVLSSRGNILLLTEEMRARAIISEPSKPYLRERAYPLGPVRLSESDPVQLRSGTVAYYAGNFPDQIDSRLINNSIIDRLRDYRGIDTIEKAIDYLEDRGDSHNNPLMSTYFAGESRIQSYQLLFLQNNVFAGKLYTTAVFTNSDSLLQPMDMTTCTYIANIFAEKLGVEKGQLVITYAPTRV